MRVTAAVLVVLAHASICLAHNSEDSFGVKKLKTPSVPHILPFQPPMLPRILSVHPPTSGTTTPASPSSTQASCYEDAIAAFGKTAAVRGRLQVGSWGHVPPGCGLWQRSTGTAHWNTNTASRGTDARWVVVKPAGQDAQLYQ